MIPFLFFFVQRRAFNQSMRSECSTFWRHFATLTDHCPDSPLHLEKANVSFFILFCAVVGFPDRCPVECTASRCATSWGEAVCHLK